MVELNFNTTTTGSIMNNSLEIGDKVYYINNPVNYQGSGFLTGDGSDGTSNMIIIGTVSAFTTTSTGFTIWAEESTGATFSTLDSGDFIFFSKDNAVNMSSVLGYYNKVIFENNSPKPAELYAVSCDITESSK